MSDAVSQGSKLANNVWVTIVARFSIIFLMACLPVAGWLISRAVNSIDNLSVKVDSMSDRIGDANWTIKLIQQTQAVQTQVVSDHEVRVRTLERILPKSQP